MSTKEVVIGGLEGLEEGFNGKVVVIFRDGGSRTGPDSILIAARNDCFSDSSSVKLIMDGDDGFGGWSARKILLGLTNGLGTMTLSAGLTG